MSINLGLLAALGVAAAAPEFPIEPIESAAARSVQEASRGRYALLNPGAAWPNKRWPPDRLGEVARALRDKHGLTSAVLWGPNVDRATASGISGFKSLLKEQADFTPLKRTVSQEEVGNAALYLLSPLASGVTGEVHYVDAGANIIGLNQV